MKTPENGGITVIDDKPEEGLPLVRALSKHGAPVTYFTGLDSGELPAAPLTGTRFVFLDIVLGTDSQNDKTKISTAAGVLSRIIGTQPQGPYVLIAWTRHEELVAGIQNALSTNPPLLVLNLEKKDCRDTNGAYVLRKIETRLNRKLAEAGVFNLFVAWENIVHRSACEVVNEITAAYPRDDKWDSELCELLRHMAVAYCGQTVDLGKCSDVARSALLGFNGIFLDTLENHVGTTKRFSGVPSATAVKSLSSEMKARINTKLLTFKGDGSIFPGNLYSGKIPGVKHPKIDELYDGKLADYLKRESLVAEAGQVALECSPLCDHAQQKIRAHRILPGVRWPVEHQKKVKKAQYIYRSPLIEIDGKLYSLVFDIRYLTSVPAKDLRSKRPVFRIRHQLLVDIQSSISGHVSRPGVTSL